MVCPLTRSEDVLVKLIFGSQEEMDANILKVRKGLKIDMLAKHPVLFTTIVMAMIGLGIYLAASKSGSSSESLTHIEANNNTIISIGADVTGMSPSDFRGIIEAAMVTDTQLANDAISIVKSAKEEGAAIIFDENNCYPVYA
ncbi:MAG: hypothetical protein ACI9OU_001049 [Candidatus Promineifilaceae bacterium]|jgi:hypothetical protein